jgi:hypothetical protein
MWNADIYLKNVLDSCVIKGLSLRQEILVHFLVVITQLFIIYTFFKLKIYGCINVIYSCALEEKILYPLLRLILPTVE